RALSLLRPSLRRRLVERMRARRRPWMAVCTAARLALALRLVHAYHGHQAAHIVFFEFFPTTPLEAARQRHAAVARADQPGDSQANRLEHAAHFAIAALAYRDPVPLVDAFAAA